MKVTIIKHQFFISILKVLGVLITDRKVIKSFKALNLLTFLL